MFIVFEGLDGAGKDTQLRKVFEYITNERKHLQVIKTQEPSGFSDIGKSIAIKLQNEGFSSPEEALNMYIGDRVAMNSFKRFNNDYGVVLCSRGDYTTYSYQSLNQGIEKGFTFDEIYNKHRELEGEDKLLIPDITFYFDLSIDETMNRINKRLKEGEKKDFFERRDFLEKARKSYLDSIIYLRKKENRNIFILDASKSIGEIHKDVISILIPFLKS